MISRLLDRWSRATIIVYHRVIDRDVDPWGLAVSRSHFRAQLAQLRSTHTVLPVEDLLRRAAERRLRDKAVAITFDDGYLDNLQNAAPCLAEFDMPATLFLATGPMAVGAPYWWDTLAAMILDADALEAEVTVAGRIVRIILPEREPADADRRGWRAWQAQRTAREALFYSLWDSIRVLAPEQARDVVAQLAAIFPNRVPDEDRPMTAVEVARLLSVAPVRLGGHTVDHPDLPALCERDARLQIAEGRRQVVAIAGRDVPGFAYPYGRHDPGVMRLAADAGFGFACTTAGGRLHRSDPFALPRVTARNTPDIGWLYG